MKKWQKPERTVEDLNRICGESFAALKIPYGWKFKEYVRTRLKEDETSEIQSITGIYVNTRTSGFELKHYRINFHTYSELMSIVEVTFKDFGKPNYVFLVGNRTPGQLNEKLAEL